MSTKTYAFWCRYPSSRNFGDALTPWLIRQITGSNPEFARPQEAREKYLMVGSIIGYATTQCIVWGAGILNADDHISPEARLLAVRGPLTYRRALECGVDCPPVYGDPALLLPRFYRPADGVNVTKSDVGVVPHFLDKPLVITAWLPNPSLRYIDVQQPIESVINAITSCSFIISSSLHGIIVANAYGIPALWVRFSDRPHGDGSKFRDYFISTRQPQDSATTISPRKIELDWILSKRFELKLDFDLDPLWTNCPLREIK